MSNITVCPTCGQSVSPKRLEIISKEKLDAQRLASPEARPWTKEDFPSRMVKNEEEDL